MILPGTFVDKNGIYVCRKYGLDYMYDISMNVYRFFMFDLDIVFTKQFDYMKELKKEEDYISDIVDYIRHLVKSRNAILKEDFDKLDQEEQLVLKLKNIKIIGE